MIKHTDNGPTATSANELYEQLLQHSHQRTSHLPSKRPQKLALTLAAAIAGTVALFTLL